MILLHPSRVQDATSFSVSIRNATPRSVCSSSIVL